MKSYTIHMQSYGPDAVPDVRAVRDGFNWAAFLFTTVWALVKGYWWVAAGTLAVSLALSAALAVIGLDLYGQTVVNLGFNLLVGLYGNDLARWTLARRGFVEKDVVSAEDSDHALSRFAASLN